jgi:hypothetical protein
MLLMFKRFDVSSLQVLQLMPIFRVNVQINKRGFRICHRQARESGGFSAVYTKLTFPILVKDGVNLTPVQYHQPHIMLIGRFCPAVLTLYHVMDVIYLKGRAAFQAAMLNTSHEFTA